MKKEKQVKSYTRKTKAGKVVTVKAHTAKYDAAEAAKEALKGAAKKSGAGSEYARTSKGWKKPEDIDTEEWKDLMDTLNSYTSYYKNKGRKNPILPALKTLSGDVRGNYFSAAAGKFVKEALANTEKKVWSRKSKGTDPLEATGSYLDKYESRKSASIAKQGTSSPYWKHPDNTREGLGKYLIGGGSHKTYSDRDVLKGNFQELSADDVRSYGGRGGNRRKRKR